MRVGARGDVLLAFHFGKMVLDAERRELRSGSKLFSIEPMVFDLLELLIRNRDRVVSRGDLIAGVWGSRIALVTLALVLTVGATLQQLPAHISEPTAQFNVLRSSGILSDSSAPTAGLPVSSKRICAMTFRPSAIGEESDNKIRVCRELLQSEAYFPVEPMHQRPPKPEDDPQCKKWTNEGWCAGGCTRAMPGGKPQCVMPGCAILPDGVIPPPRPAQCLEYF